MEYDYAVKTGKPIIVFLHNDIASIPISKSEKSMIGSRRLEAFRKKASTGREVAFWTNKDNLKSAVIMSIQNTIQDYPNGGWIKAAAGFDESLFFQDHEGTDNISGHWKSYTELEFEDESVLKYNPSTHLITGHIKRIMPENQNKRTWRCVGCLVGDSLTMFYYSRYGAGCALFRLFYEDLYKGYYLRFNYKIREIERIAVQLQKIKE